MKRPAQILMTLSLISVVAFGVACDADSQAVPPGTDQEAAELLGPLPRPSDILEDVLRCAGASEVYWLAAMKADPRDPRAHEAKRKAGWYTAVALNVFAVGTDAIFAAIASARSSPTGAIERVEAECREAPTNWRE